MRSLTSDALPFWFSWSFLDLAVPLIWLGMVLRIISSKCCCLVCRKASQKAEKALGPRLGRRFRNSMFWLKFPGLAWIKNERLSSLRETALYRALNASSPLKYCVFFYINGVLQTVTLLSLFFTIFSSSPIKLLACTIASNRRLPKIYK